MDDVPLKLAPFGFGVGIFLAFLIPNRIAPWYNFFHEYAAALAFVPVVFVAFGRGFEIPRIGWIAIGLAALVWVQYFLGLLIFAGDAWLASLYLLGGACVMAAARRCASDRTMTSVGWVDQPLWVGLVLSGLVSVAIAFHQWLDLGRFALFFVEMPPGGRPYGNLGQPNHLASLCLLAVLGVWVLWEKQTVGTRTAVLAAVCLMVGLVLTLSRTPLAATIWLVPILIWARHRRWIRLPVAATVAFLSLLLVLNLNMEHISKLLLYPGAASRVFESVALYELRPEIWRDALRAIQQSPWWGFGWYQSPIAQQLVADGTQRLGVLLPSFHNAFLDLVVWIGVPAALLFLFLLGKEYLAQFNARMGVTGLAAWLGVAVVLNHAMLEYAQLYAYFWLPMCWWLGHLSVYTSPPLMRASWRWRVVYGVCVAGCAALLVAVGWDVLRYQSDWQQMRFREALMDRSIDVPNRQPVLLDQLDARLEMVLYDPFATPRDTPPPLAAQTTLRYPYPSNLLKLAIIQATSGQPQAASETMDLLCRMYRQWACEPARTTWEVIGRTQIPELAHVALKPTP